VQRADTADTCAGSLGQTLFVHTQRGANVRGVLLMGAWHTPDGVQRWGSGVRGSGPMTRLTIHHLPFTISLPLRVATGSSNK